MNRSSSPVARTVRRLSRLLGPDPGQVTFCDRCGTVCDASCRRDQLRDQALERASDYHRWD